MNGRAARHFRDVLAYEARRHEQMKANDIPQQGLIGAYRGTSWVSKAIRWVNWGPYSHVNHLDPSADSFDPNKWRGIEAWGDTRWGIPPWTGKVMLMDNPSVNHADGTRIDLFKVEGMTLEQHAAVWSFLFKQIGKGYDFRALIHFINRRPENPDDQDKWFCSELEHAAHAAAGIKIVKRYPSYKVYPTMLVGSPDLRYVGTIYAGHLAPPVMKSDMEI